MSALILLAAAMASPPPVDYRDPAHWLCRPGRVDACAGDLAATTILPDGTTRIDRAPRANMAKADCFYVYPTTSMNDADHSDVIPGDGENGMAASQAAPLRNVCRVYAPLYRQVTLPALRRAMRDGKRIGADDFALPYADVRAAFRDYFARDNGGRPFVLVGHSQGSALLKRLVVDEIDGKPLARQMLSAILPGTAVMVPHGKDVGGDLKATPLCRSDAQTGCIVTWASYRDTNPPPANGLFGRDAADGALQAGCTNPARLGGGAAPLDPVLGFPWWRGGVATFRQPATWSVHGKALTTRFVRMPGLLSAACVGRGGFSYLAVTVRSGRAADTIAATVGADAVGDTAWPDWGLHVVDVAIVEGDLARLVGAQTQAWYRAKRK